MKVSLQYAITVHGDDGELLADAEARLSVTSVEQLVQAIVNTMTSTMSAIDKADTAPLGNTAFDQLLKTAGIHAVKQ